MRQASSCASATCRHRAARARRISIRTVLMMRSSCFDQSKRFRQPSRVQIHIRLTMWIIGAKAGLCQDGGAKISSRRAICAGCCSSVTVTRIFTAIAQCHKIYDRMTSWRRIRYGAWRAISNAWNRCRAVCTRDISARATRARPLCAARRACDRSDRAASCAAGSTSASPRRVRRPRYRRAPFPASCESAA